MATKIIYPAFAWICLKGWRGCRWSGEGDTGTDARCIYVVNVYDSPLVTVEGGVQCLVRKPEPLESFRTNVLNSATTQHRTRVDHLLKYKR